MKKNKADIKRPFRMSLSDLSRLFKTILKPSFRVASLRGLKVLIILKAVAF